MRLLRTIALSLLLIQVCNEWLDAQTTHIKSKLWMEGKMHYGFIMAHHDNMVHLTSQHLCMFEADLVQASNGKRYWEQQHKYPLKGIGFLYSDLGGSVYLGKVIAVIPYINFQLTKGKKVNLFFRFGTGVGYLTRCFSRTENYKNIAIGSRFNAGIQMMYEVRWKALPRLEINGGIGLTHFSNGSIKMPNLGINLVTINGGVAYKLDNIYPVRIRDTVVRLPDRKWRYSVFALFGISELYAAYGPKFPAFILSASFLKPIGKIGKRAIGIGLDITYDEANVESLSRLGKEVDHKMEVVKPGLALTYVMDFSRLSLVLQVGGYVYTLDKSDGYVYDRLALQYRFGKHYLVHLALKTHFFKADMIEYGVGYRF